MSSAAVLIASRESAAVLLPSIEAAAAALAALRQPAVLDVLVNGNPALAEAMRPALQQRPLCGASLRIRLSHIAHGDKAQAINAYLHTLWPGADCTFFIDGYVRARAASTAQLAAALQARPGLLAVTAVPTHGRSAAAQARQLIEHGGLHGNFHALSRAAVSGLRERGFRLPIGLYRTDSTLGSALAFGLDPAVHGWQPQAFVATVAQASWDLHRPPLWRWSTWQTHWRRRAKQAQGDLENWAVRWHYLLQKHPIGALPPTVAALVQGWAAADPEGFAERLQGQPRRQAAWARLQQLDPAAPAPERLQPQALGDWATEGRA